MNPSVSILIPVYNRDQLIGRCIQTALDQTFQDIEVIVVDNTSSDKTWKKCIDIATHDRRVRVYRNEVNIGPVKNWGECFKYATGTYVKVLFSDDWMEPDYLKTALALFQNDVGMVSSQVIRHIDGVDNVAYTNCYSSVYPSRKLIEGMLSFSDYCVSPSAWIFRRDDFMNLFLIDIPNQFGIDYSSHGMGTDTLILLGVAEKYRFIGNINKPLIHFEAANDSITFRTNRDEYLLNRIVANAYYVESHRSYFDHNFLGKFNMLSLISMIKCFDFGGLRAYLKLFGRNYPRFAFSVDLIYFFKKNLSLLRKYKKFKNCAVSE